MRLARNSIISASLLLAASMGGMGLASAQGDDAAQEVFAPEDAEDADLVPETETADGDVDAEIPADFVESDEAPEAGAAESDGAVLAAPGSTEESNSGGSSRPGTTPDT
jgi:hypothetical protein